MTAANDPPSGTSSEEGASTHAAPAPPPPPLPFLTANQRDACLRVLRLRGKKKNGSEDDDDYALLLSSLREASDLFRGDPVEAFLFVRLKENYRHKQAGSVVPRTHVYRDFVRLYQQLRASPPASEEEENESQGEDEGAAAASSATKAPAVRQPHSLLVAARNVIDRLSHVDDDDSAVVPQELCAYVIASLGRLVRETTLAVVSIKDWDRLWDVVSPKFVRALPTCVEHETSAQSQQEGVAGTHLDGYHDVLVVGTGSGTSPSRQVELLAWKLFCVGLHCMAPLPPPAPQQPKQQQQVTSPTSTTAAASTATATTNAADANADEDASGAASTMRRLRLAVACGALALLAALYETTYPGDDESGPHEHHDDKGDEDEPPGKRVRYVTLAESMIDALKDPSAKLNRFGEPYKTADALADGTITAGEIEEQAEALAKLVWSVTAVSKPAAARAAAGTGVRMVGSATAKPSRIKFLWKLEKTGYENESTYRFFLPTHHVVPLLARTVDNLYHQTNLRAASAKSGTDDDGLLYDVGTLVELDSLDALDDPRRSRLLSRLADEFSSANRTVVTRPVFTEAMELNEWSVSLMNIQTVKPCNSLFDMIEATKPGSVMRHIVPILNRVLHRIGEEFVTESMMYRHMSVYVIDTGRVMIYGNDTSDKKFAKAVVALYYHALEAILLCEAERLRGSSPLARGRPASDWRKPPPRDHVDEILHARLISSPTFHTALLACSLLCVHKAVGATQLVMSQLHAFSAMHVCECYPEDFLKVSEAFHRSLWGNTPARGKVGSGLVFAIPRLLWKEVRKAERNTLDTFLWKGEVHSFMGRIEGFREKRYWPPESLGPDEDDDPALEDGKSNAAAPFYKELRSIAYVFRRVLSLASARIVSLLEFLRVNPRPIVARQAYVALRFVLRRHLDLLHDRHLDHMILCCLYGVAKRLKCEPEITFGMLVDAYVAVRGQDEGDVTCQRILRHIKLVTDVDESNDEPIGDIIQLYNRVFVPRMKRYLLKSTPLQRAAVLLMDPMHNSRGSRETVAGMIQVSIRSNADRTRLQRDLLNRNGAVTLVEIGAPSSYKAVEVANELTRRSIPNV